MRHKRYSLQASCMRPDVFAMQSCPRTHRTSLPHVDAAVLADPEAPGQSVLDGGTRVSAETSQRLACDATRVVMASRKNVMSARR